MDWQIAHTGPKGTVRSPKLECQVKSRSNPDFRDNHYLIRLTVERYNKIAGFGFQVPRFLFVVVVPAEANDYAQCSHECMTLGTAGYWMAMANLSVIDVEESDHRSVVVEVPKTNLLTIETLQALLAGDLEGATA